MRCNGGYHPDPPDGEPLPQQEHQFRLRSWRVLPYRGGPPEGKCEVRGQDLLHWTLNALNRHGYQCTFAPQADLPTLEAISTNELKWTEHNDTQIYASFETLLSNIKPTN